MTMRKWFLKPVTLFMIGTAAMVSCTKLENISNLDPKAPATPQKLGMNNLVTISTVPLVVSTLAGNGIEGWLEGAGTEAEFASPADVVADAFGNVYVADYINSRIRKITPAGIVSTLSGGINDSSGPLIDGPGTKARFGIPAGMAIDAAGNLYIADLGTNRIRKVAPDGSTTTIAGSGPRPYKGGFADGSVINAKFNGPASVAVDAAGNIFVADLLNNRIRKISNFNVTTYAGDGVNGSVNGPGATARFSGPSGVAVDANGNVYVADQFSSLIRKITPDRVVSTLAGSTTGFADGTGTAAKFNAPNHIRVDASGNVYVADAGNNRIRKITPAGVVTTLAGNGVAGFVDGGLSVAQFKSPLGVTTDAAGNFYVADAGNERIRKIAPAPAVNTLAGNGTPGIVDATGTDARFNLPAGTAFDPFGNLYVADQNNNRIRKISPGGAVNTFAGSIRGFADGFGFSARFNAPTGVAADEVGNVYVTDCNNHLIRKISNSGEVTTLAGDGALAGNAGNGFADGQGTQARFSYPYGIAVDRNGDVYVADHNNNRIRKISAFGFVTTLAGTGTAGFNDGQAAFAQFNGPSAVAVDIFGFVYVADQGNNRIRKIDPNGNVSTLAGNGTRGFLDGSSFTARFSNPIGLTVDEFQNVYVTDFNNQRIRKITINGNVTTVAGNGIAGYTDGANPDAQFSHPLGISIRNGILYIGDQDNQSIRTVRLN